MSGSLIGGVGMNVPPDGRWTAAMLPADCRWVRYPHLRGRDPLPMAAGFVAGGKVPAIVVARESLVRDYAGPLPADVVRETLADLHARLQPLAGKIVIILGNEWDARRPAPGESSSSWILEPDEVDLLLIEGAAELPMFERWGPACSSGFPDKWPAVTRRNLVSTVPVHPYGRRYGDVPVQYNLEFVPLRDGYRAVLLPGQTLAFTEVGAPRADLGGSADVQADYVTAAGRTIAPDPWAWFCVDDAQVDGYGISGRPGWAAFERACMEAKMVSNDDLLQQVWHAGGTAVPFNRDASICKKWIAMTASGDPLGIPVTNEVTVQQTPLIVGQGFSSGRRLYWRGGEDVTEKAP
jgi:hypothetical protein